MPSSDAHAEAKRAWKRLARRQRGSADEKPKMSEDGVSWMRQGAADTGAQSAHGVSGSDTDVVGSEMGGRDVQMERQKKPVSLDWDVE